jgi:hypothetical protein
VKASSGCGWSKHVSKSRHLEKLLSLDLRCTYIFKQLQAVEAYYIPAYCRLSLFFWEIVAQNSKSMQGDSARYCMNGTLFIASRDAEPYLQ